VWARRDPGGAHARGGGGGHLSVFISATDLPTPCVPSGSRSRPWMSEENETPPARGVACSRSRGVDVASYRKGEVDDPAGRCDAILASGCAQRGWC